MLKKTVLAYAVMVCGIGASQALGQTPPAPGTCLDLSCIMDMDKNSNKLSDLAKYADENAKNAAILACTTKKDAWEKYKQQLDTLCGDDKSCEKNASDCAVAYDKTFKAALDNISGNINPTSSKDSEDDGADADAAPTPFPKENSYEYCHPGGQDPEKAAKSQVQAAGKSQVVANSTTSTSDSAPVLPKTECERAALSDKMNHLDHDVKEDQKDINESQKDFISAESSGQKELSSCTSQQENLKTELAKAQTTADALPAQERQELSGQDVQIEAKLQTLESALLTEQNKLNLITGANATVITSKYSAAIDQAISDCRLGTDGKGGLQALANANALNRGSSLSDALGQVGQGVTSSKCQRDFATQLKLAAAWRTYQVELQQNQVALMQQQINIQAAESAIVNARHGASAADQAVVLKYALLMKNAQTAIASYSSALTSLTNSCMQTKSLEDQKAANAMSPVNKAQNDKRNEYCQEQYLKKNFGGVVTGDQDYEKKKLDEMHDLAMKPEVNPCIIISQSDSADPKTIIWKGGEGCSAVCKGQGVLAAPAPVDSSAK